MPCSQGRWLTFGPLPESTTGDADGIRTREVLIESQVEDTRTPNSAAFDWYRDGDSNPESPP